MVAVDFPRDRGLRCGSNSVQRAVNAKWLFIIIYHTQCIILSSSLCYCYYSETRTGAPPRCRKGPRAATLLSFSLLLYIHDMAFIFKSSLKYYFTFRGACARFIPKKKRRPAPRNRPRATRPQKVEYIIYIYTYKYYIHI